MRTQGDTTARIAVTQHGRITHEQLLAAGVDAQRIKRWIASGRLRRLYRGVYALGHTAPSLLGDYLAAVLACGAGAALSHRAAGHVFRLLAGRPPPAEVTVPTTAGRKPRDFVIHRVRELDPRDVIVYQDTPITIVQRVLLDLAPGLSLPELTRACHEAWIKHRVSPPMVEACIDRNPTKKAIKKLRLALGGDVTLSVLEDGFLALLREHDLELPRMNIDVAGDKVDCHWPQHGLTIELLSYRFHGSRRAFEADVARRRRSHHIAFTYGDVFERGQRTVAEVAKLLYSSSTKAAGGSA